LELESTDQLLVGEFEAPPRDSLAARALSEALRSSLSESRAIRIVSRAELDQALQRMELPVTTRLLAPVVAELTARNGYEAVLAGAITPLGQGYVVSARLLAADGRELAALSEAASSADALISAVGRLGSQLRRLVGESAKVLDSVPPLWQVTTRSLRALELFSQAQRVSGVEGSEPPRVMALLHQALHEDSTFAMAHRRIGMAYLNLGRTREGVRALRAAERFSDRLTEVERLTALSSLHGYLRQHPLALEEAAAILRREPENGWAKIKVVWEYLLTERYLEAEAYIRGMGGTFPRPALWPDLRQLQGHGAEALDSARASYRLSEGGIGMRGRPAARRRLAKFHAANFAIDSADYWSRPLPGGDGGSPRIFVSALLSRGRLREAFAARGVRPRGREREASAPNIAFIDEALAALATALLTSDRAAASRRLDAVLADSAYRVMDPVDRPVRPLIALALAGRVEEARRELDGIEHAADADVRAARHPELFLARGAVAMAEQRWPEAIADFRRASSEVNWGSEDACRVCALPWLGRAFDLANRPDSAAAVLERYLSTGDSYRDVVDATWRAISLRRLGELHAQLGDTARALGRLAEFTELWKGADPELQPQVVEARRRILELESGTRTVR
jgi:tetratricopeptide (TPR) repeat protein